MTSFRRLGRDLAIYGSGDVVLRATAFLTLPIYSRLFEPGEYGVWTFFVTLTFLLNAVLLLGGDAAYGRFYFATRSDEERQALTSTAVVSLAVASGVAVLACLTFADEFSRWAFDTPRYGTLFVLSLLATPVVVVNTMLGEGLRMQFRAGVFAALNVTTAALGVALSLLFILGLDLGVKGVLLGGLIAGLAILPLRAWFVRGLLRPRFSAVALRRLLGFGLPLVPAAIAGWIFSVSDRIVIGKLSTLHELGLYSVAGSVASVLTVLVGPLGQAWAPHAVQAYEHDEAEASRFYGRVLTYILAGFGFLCVLVAAFAPELLALLATPEFDGASRAIAPLALGAVAYATIQVTALSISLRHRTSIIAALSWAAALLNLVLNLLFVPRWGMIASAWATAVSSLVLTLSYLAVSQRLWRVSYETRRALGIAAATVAFTLVALVLPELGAAAAVPLKAAYCLAYVAVLFLLGALDRRETSAARVALSGLPLVGARRS